MKSKTGGGGLSPAGIDFMNRTAGEILGVNEEDVIGKFCFEVFHAHICEHSFAMKETLETGGNVTNKTISYRYVFRCIS